MMEVTLSVAFGYEASEEVRALLEDFREMVNLAIENALEANVTGYARLRKLIYDEWKRRWDYSTHFCHSACRVATSMLKSWRRLKRKGKVKGDKPVARKLFMHLDPQLVKYEGERIRISVKPRKFLTIHLKYGDYQRRFIEEWKKGALRVGEITINEKKVLVPFRKDVDLSDPDDWIAIDINEGNITAMSSNPHIFRFETDIREIRSAYFEKRRRIQRLSKHKPITSKRLMSKYSKRERNRIKDRCHKIAKSIVSVAKANGWGIILEDLKGMRDRIHYGRKMNRRLHAIPFRKIQSCIEYKAKIEGLPVIYVDARSTSSLCPVCGGRLKKAPNGHRILRCDCGYENDRDVIACLNLLRRNPRCGELPFPPNAFYDVSPKERQRRKASDTNVIGGQNGFNMRVDFHL